MSWQYWPIYCQYKEQYSKKIEKMVKYRFNIGNICNETPLFQKYWQWKVEIFHDTIEEILGKCKELNVGSIYHAKIDQYTDNIRNSVPKIVFLRAITLADSKFKN